MKVSNFNLCGRLALWIALAFFGVTASSRADLIALYRFESATTADVTDKIGAFSGNTYNGTAVGDAVSLSSDVSGVNVGSKSLSLGGSGDYITLPISAVNPFDGSQSYTITCWFKQADLAGSNMIILSSARDTSSGNHAMAFFLHNSPEGNLRTDNFFINQNNVGSGWDDNNWHFGAVTYEPGTGFRLRVDNTYSSTVNFDPAIPSISSDTVIIGDTLNTDFPTPGDFAGLLDDVAIFNHKLSDAELDNVRVGNFSAYATLTPEIDMTGNGVSITSGDTTPSMADHTDFGSTVSDGGTVTRTFTIKNTGTVALNLTGTPTVQISGADAAQFTVTAADFGLAPITVANSGFELPAYGAAGFSYLSGLNSSWTYGGNSGVAHNGSPWYINPAPEGTQAAFIQNDGAGAYFQQAFNFPAAGSYDVSFWIVRRSVSYPANDIDVRMDGVSIGSVPNTSQTTDTWAKVTFTYNCPSAGSHTLAFVGTRGGADYDSAIDDVTVSVASTQIAPGASAAFQIKYAPSAVGGHTATVTITSDDSDEGTYTFDITGTASSSNLPSGAVAWWRAENNALDSIGSNNGTLNGGATYAAGHIGNAFSFNTVGDNITVPDSASLDLGGSFTIEAWVYLTNRNSHYMIVTKAPSVGPSNYPGNYELRVTPTTGYLELGFEYSGGLNFWTSTSAVPLNQWSHIAVVYTSGTSVEFFVDGVSSGTSSTTRTPLVNNSILRIAARADGYSFNGAIDELALFSRALTASEIQHIIDDDYIAAAWDGSTGNGNGTGNSSADQLRIRRNGSNIEFSADGGTSWSATLPYASTTVLTLTGSSDDDTFVIDFSGGNPIPSGGLVIAGAGQVSAGDAVIIDGGSHTTVTYGFLNNSDGTIEIDGSLITYTGLEPITDNSDAVNRVFDFTGGAETITVKSVSATQTFVDSTLGESVTFNNPTATMTINAGTGDDNIDFGSLSSGWAATVTLNGGAGNDTFYLSKTVSTSAAITLNGDAHTAGDILNFDREGDTAITSSGASPGTVSGGSPAIQTVNYDTVETINMYLYGSPGDYVIADRGPYFSTGTILLYKTANGTQQVVDTTIKDPYEISLDASGNFVIADYEVNAGTAGIYLIDRLTGTKSTVSSDGAFEVPFGVKADTSGGVNNGKYIVADLDADNNGASAWGALLVVDPGSASPGNQTLLSSRTTGTGTFFYWLTGLALGGSGDIYVCDQGNLSSPGTQPPRVFHVDPTTGNRTVMAQGGTMGRPVGVVVLSGTGNTAQLLVVDAGSKKLLRFTGTGSPITISGTEELTHSGVTFDSPTHVAIDSSGNYVITDAPAGAVAGQRRIHVMDSGTLVTTTVTADGFLEQPRGVQVLP